VAHLDAAGFRYYIPAYMLSIIDAYEPSSMRVIGTLGALYPKKDRWQHHMDRYSLLNEAQRGAIASFLDALPDLVDLDHDDAKIVPRALRNYWHQFLPASA
jgi:ribosomal protein S16